MQDQIDEIKRHDARQSLSEVMKQLAQVPVHRNGLANLQEGAVLRAREKRFFVLQQVRHDEMLRMATYPERETRSGSPMRDMIIVRASPGGVAAKSLQKDISVQ